MKTKLSILTVILGITVNSFAQNIKEGTYMLLWGANHYTVFFKDKNTLEIKPCQNYQHQNSIDNETYEFIRMGDTEKFGWNGGSEVILDIDVNTNVLSFPKPINMNVPMKLMLLHPKDTAPSANVKTYFDETDGGYSPARILITDPTEIKNGDCLIHSIPTSEYNSYIVGSYDGLFGNGFSATFNADHTGIFCGLPFNWSVVSNSEGIIKKWDYADGGFLVHIMIEFENGLPTFVDPPSAGKKLAIIESLRVSISDGTVEIKQMQRSL